MAHISDIVISLEPEAQALLWRLTRALEEFNRHAGGPLSKEVLREIAIADARTDTTPQKAPSDARGTREVTTP